MKNVFKLKSMLRIAGIIALVALIGFSMAACGDEGGGPAGNPAGGSGGSGGGGGGNSGNWPPESILSQFGLSGMPAPPGATNIVWLHVPNSTLSIDFNATSATDAAVERWFDNNGWTLTSVEDYTKYYAKPPFLASYGLRHWTSSNGESHFFVCYDS